MKFVPMKVSRAAAQQMLKAKKNSPHIFFAAGVVGIVGSTFLACKATLKLEETLDDIQKELEDVKTIDPKRADSDHYKDVIYVYGKSVSKLGRLYGPSVVVGSLSVAALTGSHIQLTRRNTALMAAFSGISKAFDDYRVRVQEEIGEERELDIYRAMHNEEVTDENGKKSVQRVTDPNGWSPYARIFDEGNNNFVKNAEYNRIFIQCQQNYWNQKLQARGYVFLNEVYETLGFPQSQSGQVVGWVVNGEGDGFIDFGLYEASASGFTNGYEPRVVLDFNVDGVIYDCAF